ncbi:MAG TPA: PQQ-binding-like beta-propeller repeat protein [Bryobacteraceae bacterium]|nr:PQQ-binding-like beta-propeller repeat protein [Bryobacteraceae bacterium]
MLRAISAALLCLCGAAGQDWPSFRGPGASGAADGQKLPVAWDAGKGTNVAWETPIPGLAHSSPIVWGDRIFVTTAVSSRPDASFKRGLYGEGDASDDRSVQQWKLLCLNKKSGALLWERLAYQGVPKEKRHMKATYANATPATDGEVVVAFFGSQGMYAYALDGKPLWQRDLGRFDVGAYDLPEYEWGTASSPILYRDLVIAQCDQQKGSFLIALDRKTGQTVWKTERDELPSWGTPTIYPGKSRTELVTNASNFVRGYDPMTGKELWRLGGSSKITAPTPIFSGDIIVVASGRRPEAPIFAIRAGAAGDITLSDGHTASHSVAWSKTQRGSYMPTPLFYRGFLYVLANAGILDCYDFQTGREIYRQRIPHQGSGFSASPVASDGRIYLSSEDGDIFVVSAGEQFALLGTNSMGEPIMATPAISEGMLIIRTQHQLFGIRRK